MTLCAELHYNMTGCAELHCNMTLCAEVHCNNACKTKAVQLYNQHRYDDVPTSVEKTHVGKVTVLLKQPVLTDRTITNNKPNRMFDNKQGTCMLIDVAISGD